MKTSYLALSVSRSLSAYFPVVGLCISFCLLQKRAYLMMAELDTDL